MTFYKNKKILVTGGTGLIGRPLVDMLVDKGADVTIVSLDDPSRAPKGVKFIKADLRELSNCIEACKNKEIVFALKRLGQIDEKLKTSRIKDEPAITEFIYATLSNG